MKKKLIPFILAVGVLTVFNLSAQDKKLVSIGFKAGTNLSHYRLGGHMKDFKSKMSIGGSIGAFVKLDLTSNFGLQSGIDFHYKTSKLENKIDQSTNKLKSFGIEIPLYGMIQGELGRGKAFIGAGPYVGYGISTKSDGINLLKNNGAMGAPAMNRLDYGVGGILGYDVSKNWQIHARYQFGLADLHEAKGNTMKSQGITIGIAYKL